MAARRLLIIMLILLGISSVIAIALPKPDRDDPGSGSSAVTGATGDTGSTGHDAANRDDSANGDGAGNGNDSNTGETSVVAGQGERAEPANGNSAEGEPEGERTVSLDAKDEPVTVRATPGSRLVLTVRSETGSEVEIGGLGLTGFADEYAPAVFDVILPTEPGNYPVRAPGGKPGAVIVTS
ncbi:MAG TPA: hypothetical protein PKD76_04820 [Solirubrobacterales bacterium]|nr:hypothetical protein [Solirubrobacterales bacterium]